MSADTVRYYERHGLLPVAPRSVGGYRLFPREALLRMQLIRAALSIGFSVNELSDILRERKNGGAPCRRVRDMAADKLFALESRIQVLQTWRRDL
jgi:DNA-binding transcriptional MerR regulator